ncbi:MAG: Nif3-like dinuclear metal center hexameric protein [Candidatus Competibacteraceae bacterium]|nr:Nif3-like dinuclear metal center hexameric protein [Candidatus Competibacteraceae bacterium]
MNLKDIVSHLENANPAAYAESYDNTGLLVKGNEKVTGILVSLDCTEALIEEAISRNCNFIVCHHPIIFKGIKKLTGAHYVERTVMSAIRNNISIFAVHTNLDNRHDGVSKILSNKLGITDTQVLSPQTGNLYKLQTFVPVNHTEKVSNALFEAGAGKIGKYSECSFSVEGKGTFRGNETSQPYVGNPGERHQEAENKLEVVFPRHLLYRITVALQNAHPYEEVAYDIIPLTNSHPEIGAGTIGILPQPVDSIEFLKHVKEQLKTGCIRYSQLCKPLIQKVAVCGGSGSFLLSDAIRAGADILITADITYHHFFDADGKIILADVGHFESEQFAKDLLADEIQKKFPTFAVLISNTNTNSVNYI